MPNPPSIHSFNPARTTRGGRVTVEAHDSATELVIFGEIGGAEGVTAEAVREKLRNAVRDITVHINSGGGDFFEGVAIHNALREHRSVRVVVDGLAASAASIIAMAGTKIEMAAGAFMMIHNAWGAVVGSADDMRAAAALFDSISREIADIYAKRTGIDHARVASLMAAETWLNADEAIKLRFADGRTQTPAVFAAVDLSGFRNAPPLPITKSLPDKSSVEAALRDVGLSRRKAAALVNAGWPAIISPENDIAPLQDIAAALREGIKP